MSTSATIEVPFSAYKEFGVSSDGYPDEMIEYLEGIVERAKEKAEKKYKDPEDHWEEQLELELEKLSDGYYAELIENPRGGGEYYYKITEDGEVLFRKDREEDWREWEGGR